MASTNPTQYIIDSFTRTHGRAPTPDEISYVLNQYPAAGNPNLNQADLTLPNADEGPTSRQRPLAGYDPAVLDQIMGGISGGGPSVADTTSGGGVGGANGAVGYTPPPGGGVAIDPSFYAPWTERFNYQDFSAPDPKAIADNQAYQFRFNQGRGAIENGAAARGLLNSGGTLADILNYGQNMASQEYSNIWDRDMNAWLNQRNQAFRDYQDRENAFYTNQKNAYDRLYGPVTIGSAAAGAS